MSAVQEYKMHNADVLFKEDSTVDDLIDVIEVTWLVCMHNSGWHVVP
jgi:ribosome-interacting GTPase 1